MNPDSALVTVPVASIGVVRPVTTAEDARKAWDDFQDLKKGLLDPADVQHIGGRDFLKRSGTMKLAMAFSLNTEIVREAKDELVTRDGVAYFQWRIVVRATAPNGRYMEAVGACASNERTFAHKDADVYAQAETRATSRVISNLIGGGAVSADEMKADTKPALSREQAAELLTQFDRSCDAQHVNYDYRTLCVQLLQSADDLRRAFKYFKDQGSIWADDGADAPHPYTDPVGYLQKEGLLGAGVEDAEDEPAPD